jgi:GMP synthase (glutamine-hydrolysing)
VVGEIRVDKLETLKKATAIAESELAQHKPSQYFAVIIDNEETSDKSKAVHIQETVARLLNVPSRNVQLTIFKDKATGVQSGKRRYGDIVGIRVQTMNGQIHQIATQKLVSLQAGIITANPTVARIFYVVKDSMEKKPYAVGVRSIQTMDFLTAQVSEIPWATLEKIAEGIIEKCPSVSTVYFDVTPKPPATIEME